MVREVEAALDAGALGLSSGLIYAPGIHADTAELVSLVTAATRRGGLYATHMRNEAAGLFAALDEAIGTIRAARDGGAAGPRLQVSHLKCGARTVWGRAGEAVAVIEAARAEDLDVAADQYPYTAAATTLATVLPPSLLGLGVEDCVAALGDDEVRARVMAEMEQGISGWENVTTDPGWAAIRISFAPSHPDWAGRSLAELGEALDQHPADLAMDALVDDRLDVSVVIDCMDEADVATIAAVPWIGVCTDAEGRRPGHPILDAGRPHPRTYGTTARLLGTYVRERQTLTLEGAVAKLTAVSATRLALRDRGVLREGAFADIVVFDPATVADTASYQQPSLHPLGIDDVIVNGRIAVRDGVETGTRAGRLLRRTG
jgi:dihydroorotase/N-acyl-D-amino-acid deacylase